MIDTNLRTPSDFAGDRTQQIRTREFHEQINEAFADLLGNELVWAMPPNLAHLLKPPTAALTQRDAPASEDGGLLRQYLPRSLDFGTVTDAQLDAIAAELNERPRETLGWMTSSEKFSELVATPA